LDLDGFVDVEYTDYDVNTDEFGLLHISEVRKRLRMRVIELVAAICGDSIGYATPGHAMRHVEDYVSGKDRAYCERCMAMFGGDLNKLIESAAIYWEHLDVDRKRSLINLVKEWFSIEEESPVDAVTLGLMIPTMGIT